MRLLGAALERLKVDLRPVLEGLPVSDYALRISGGRIDWDVWVTIVERIEQTLGGPDALERFAMLAAVAPEGHPFQRVAQLLSSPVALYKLNSKWGIPHQYRHMRSECDVIAPDRLRITMTIPPHYRGSTAIFHFGIGVLRAIPKLVGLPEAQIMSREVTPFGLVAIVKPPPARTLASYAARFARRIRGLESMIEQLGEQEIEIEEKSAQLERRLAQQEVVEAALRVSEERWRALAENAPGIILLLSPDGAIQLANRALHGQEPIGLSGRRLAELVAPQHRDELEEA
ncbi:MAG: PAS domain S-box protein, partial [Polyangiaceae bacterium]